MGLVTVRDEWTKLVGHRFLNSQICFWIGSIQIIVCFWGVAQHGYSYSYYSKILKCDFLEGTLPLEAADAIIFDVGLFSSLWGIRGCVAEYLDGGFGRLAWCISHIISLFVSLPFAFSSRPRPCYLWPLLIQSPEYNSQ
uniref:Ovule protein n=1 Tax=Heterorhabditis bacteriophora TaxID=37862 RepID=A0A1I7X192_HETBA